MCTLWVNRKRIGIDTGRRGDACKMLVRLHEIEVGSCSGRETRIRIQRQTAWGQRSYSNSFDSPEWLNLARIQIVDGVIKCSCGRSDLKSVGIVKSLIDIWRDAFLKGDAGVFTVDVAQAVDFVETTMKS